MSLPLSTNQRLFSLRSILNQVKILIPHSPKSFDKEKCFQFTKWYLFLTPEEPQRKAKINFLSLTRIEIDIGTISIQ